MSQAFADTVYWVARINPRDQWHVTFQAVENLWLLTTDEVLDEVLAHFSAFGPAMRSCAAAIIRRILVHPDIEVVPQSRQSFLERLGPLRSPSGQELQPHRLLLDGDHAAQGISQVLTRDAHFAQEGFALLP